MVAAFAHAAARSDADVRLAPPGGGNARLLRRLLGRKAVGSR
jgi:hypothetical protein